MNICFDADFSLTLLSAQCRKVASEAMLEKYIIRSPWSGEVLRKSDKNFPSSPVGLFRTDFETSQIHFLFALWVLLNAYLPRTESALFTETPSEMANFCAPPTKAVLCARPICSHAECWPVRNAINLLVQVLSH